MKQEIIANRIKCKKCGDIIESKNIHDFIMCSCGSCGADGGKDYLRRIGDKNDWQELSVVYYKEDLEGGGNNEK